MKKLVQKDVYKWYNIRWANEDASKLAPWHYVTLRKLEDCNVSDKKILDVGCGIGRLLRNIICNIKVGIDPSSKALQIASKNDKGYCLCATAENLPFESENFDIVLFLEVVEHTSNPKMVLNEINRVLKKDGLLILSFPNYVHILWLFVRIASEIFNKPGWINLQPIDRIFFYPQIREMLANSGFKVIEIKGTIYLPPVIYNVCYSMRGKLDSYRLNHVLDKLGLYFFAFHPIIVCKACVNRREN